MHLKKATKLIGLATILCGILLLSMKSNPQPTGLITQQDTTSSSKLVLTIILDGETVPTTDGTIPAYLEIDFQKIKDAHKNLERRGDSAWLHITTK